MLAQQPGIGARCAARHYSDVRRLYLARTRYHVYYRVTGGKLIVLAFWHASRGRGLRSRVKITGPSDYCVGVSRWPEVESTAVEVHSYLESLGVAVAAGAFLDRGDLRVQAFGRGVGRCGT